MKKVISLMLIFIVIFSIVGCSGQDKDSATNNNIQPDQLKSNATKFVNLLKDHNFEEAHNLFDSNVKTALPVKTLEKTWNDLLAQTGEFQSIVDIRIDSSNKNFDTAIVATQFKNTILDIQVTYNKAGEVAGLYFRPHTEVPKETTNSENNAYTEKEVSTGTSDYVLPGTLTIPNGEGPFPLVILVHGSGPSDRDETFGPNKPFMDLAHGLANKGIAVYRYDKRTFVYGKQIAADMDKFTVYDEEIEDALASISKLGQQEKIDKNRIYVLGHSLGGTLIPRIASYDNDAAGYIIMAGATRPLQDIMLEQYTYIFSLDGKISDEEQKQLDAVKDQVAKINNLDKNSVANDNSLLLGVPANYWLDLNSYSPAETAKEMKKPLLILQGERDYQVTMDNFEIWQNTLQNKDNVELKTYPKLNHLFFEGEGQSTPIEYQNPSHIPDYVISDIANWVDNN